MNRSGLKPLSSSPTRSACSLAPSPTRVVIAAASGRPELRRLGTPPAPPRIALCRTPYWEQADAPAREALAVAAERFRAAGAIVVDCELPTACGSLADAGMRILVHEARQALAHELRTSPHLVSTSLRQLLERDDPNDPAPYDAARRLAVECRVHVEDAVFSACDTILTPSTPGEAPVGLTSTGSPVFNHLWSLIHVPCVNLPGLTGPSGMPVGVQLVGPRGRDVALLTVAKWAEHALSSAD